MKSEIFTLKWQAFCLHVAKSYYSKVGNKDFMLGRAKTSVHFNLHTEQRTTIYIVQQWQENG